MRHKNFFILPNRIFELGLKPKEFAVYSCLVRHSDNESDSCFPSRSTIAKECNMDKKTVDSAIKTLINKGLIQKIHRHRTDGTKASNLYFLVRLLE